MMMITCTCLILVDPQSRRHELEGPPVVDLDPVVSLRTPAAVPLDGGSERSSDSDQDADPEPAEEPPKRGQHGQQHPNLPGTVTGAAGPPPFASSAETHSGPYHRILARFVPESRSCPKLPRWSASSLFITTNHRTAPPAGCVEAPQRVKDPSTHLQHMLITAKVIHLIGLFFI